MPNWYYDKRDLKNTPSIRDGLSFETDRRYRKEGARFIMECGTKMGLGHNTMATGVVYFHRFYVFHSFKSFPRYVTACCCLFLAGKVEETPKKCKDIIKQARSMLTDQKYESFGDDPKEEVMTLERILLQTIKFDLQVEHPYSFLVKYAKCLKGDQMKLQKMVQMAWNFVNDSLSTTVCLQWEPEIIAVALIHLASKLSKFSVTKWEGQQPKHLRWWDMFVEDVTMEILEDICHQVLDLYQQANSTVESPPQLPPSKSSPPSAKRARVSPVYNKSSPIPVLVTTSNVAAVSGGGGSAATLSSIMAIKASIDEKLEHIMPHHKNVGMTADCMSYSSYPPSYGSMFSHAQFGGGGSVPQMMMQTQQHQQPAPPPPIQPSHHQNMYAQMPPAHQYGVQQHQPPPPQQVIQSHYTGSGGGSVGGGHPMHSTNYYQQPPPQGRGGGGGYYQ